MGILLTITSSLKIDNGGKPCRSSTAKKLLRNYPSVVLILTVAPVFWRLILFIRLHEPATVGRLSGKAPLYPGRHINGQQQPENQKTENFENFQPTLHLYSTRMVCSFSIIISFFFRKFPNPQYLSIYPQSPFGTSFPSDNGPRSHWPGSAAGRAA